MRVRAHSRTMNDSMTTMTDIDDDTLEVKARDAMAKVRPYEKIEMVNNDER